MQIAHGVNAVMLPFARSHARLFTQEGGPSIREGPPSWVCCIVISPQVTALNAGLFD
jgi:hypothetical protein